LLSLDQRESQSASSHRVLNPTQASTLTLTLSLRQGEGTGRRQGDIYGAASLDPHPFEFPQGRL